MKMYIRLEQNLSGIWVELMVTEAAAGFNSNDLLETIQNIQKANIASFVFENEKGDDIAIAFDGTAGPLRLTTFNA